MSTKYGTLNVDFFSKWNHTVSADALAISLSFPSVERSGTPGTRQGLKAPGLGSFYVGMALNWGSAGIDSVLRDLDYAVITGSTSNKQNHMEGLVKAGLIVKFREAGGWQVALTDLGVARAAAISKELGKVARDFTVAAREKLIKARDKAAKPARVRRPRKPKVVVEVPVEVPEHRVEGSLAEFDRFIAGDR